MQLGNKIFFLVLKLVGNMERFWTGQLHDQNWPSVDYSEMGCELPVLLGRVSWTLYHAS